MREPEAAVTVEPQGKEVFVPADHHLIGFEQGNTQAWSETAFVAATHSGRNT